MSEDKQKVTTTIKKIISELAGEYQGDMSKDTLKLWEQHAMLLQQNGMTVQEIDDKLNALFWSVANDFGA